MSIVDNLRGKAPAGSPGAPQAPDITRQLEQARSALAELEARRDTASLDAFSDAPGAKDALAKLNAEVRAAHASVEMLRAAHRGAVERDRTALLRQRKEQIETAQRSVVSNLALRDKAADLCAAAIAEASKHYRAMHRHNEAAYHVWTAAGMLWPSGAISDVDLKRLAADEGWRHTTGDLGGDNLKLPGAEYSKLEYQHNPSAAPRLDDVLREDSAWIKDQISKQVPK
jgi:hypothetical protein